MKMNAIKFAELIGFVTAKTGMSLNFSQISVIGDLIDEGITPEALPTDVSKQTVSAYLYDIKGYISRGEKINAIRAVREITGMPLKDAKDWVEAWPSKPADV